MAFSIFSNLKQNQASPFNGATLLSTDSKGIATFRLANGQLATVDTKYDPLWAQIFKGAVSAAVGTGFGAGGLAAFAPETAAGLGITGGGAGAGAGAVPIEAAGSGLSLGGAVLRRPQPSHRLRRPQPKTYSLPAVERLGRGLVCPQVRQACLALALALELARVLVRLIRLAAALRHLLTFRQKM